MGCAPSSQGGSQPRNDRTDGKQTDHTRHRGGRLNNGNLYGDRSPTPPPPPSQPDHHRQGEPAPPPREPTPPPREPTPPPPREPTPPPPREPTPPPPREPTPPPPREPTPPTPREPTPPPPPPPEPEPEPAERMTRQGGDTRENYTESYGIYECKPHDFRQNPKELDQDFSKPPSEIPFTDYDFGADVAIQGERVEWKRPGVNTAIL